MSVYGQAAASTHQDMMNQPVWAMKTISTLSCSEQIEHPARREFFKC